MACYHPPRAAVQMHTKRTETYDTLTNVIPYCQLINSFINYLYISEEKLPTCHQKEEEDLEESLGPDPCFRVCQLERKRARQNGSGGEEHG